MSRTKSKARDFSKMKSGTNAGDMVQLDSSGRLPAVDGSQLTGIEGVPSGIIAMWSGTNATIPTGWSLCDGTGGTPDLRDRFIVGSGSTYTTGDTGGANTVALSESELPSHSHNFSGNTSNTGAHSHNGSTSNTGSHSHTAYWANSTGGNNRFHQMRTGANYGTNGVLSNNGAHSHNFSTSNTGAHSHSFSGTTGTTGTTTAHENRPPYYALAYIMKD